MFFSKKYLELEVEKGPGQGRTRVLENGRLTIGSGEREADFRLTGRRIQPSHLYVEVNDAVPTLFNQATGSTRIQKKGQRSSAVIEPMTLAAGDSIQIGDETLLRIRKSDVKAQKDDSESASAVGAMTKTNKNTLTYIGVALLYGGGAWFFLVYEPEMRARSAVTWMNESMIDACARNALDYTANATPTNLSAPSTEALDLGPDQQWLDIMVRPGDPWRVITSTRSTAGDKARARTELVEALKVQLDRGEVLARRGDWTAAMKTYELIDAMVPSAPVKVALGESDESEAEGAPEITCDLKQITQSRLDLIRNKFPSE